MTMVKAHNKLNLLQWQDFNLEDTDDIKMAVSEACKNVSCHGEQGLSDQYEISLRWMRDT